MRSQTIIRRCCLIAIILFTAVCAFATDATTETITVGQLIVALRAKAKILESSKGMRQGFVSFTSAYKIPQDSISYSDFVMARLLFEATRDAGFWNLHWAITDQQPNSDKIWSQWQNVDKPSPLKPTATAECDELSALYAFLMRRTGVKGVGLFWPYANHTVAVWVLQSSNHGDVRVVVPTTQLFLQENDFFGTKRFNAWQQKSIYEYRRSDVPDSFQIPKPLALYFLHQVDQYAGATNTALQRLRYLREAVFLGALSPANAAQTALRLRDDASVPTEDANGYWNFAQDMRSGQQP